MVSLDGLSHQDLADTSDAQPKTAKRNPNCRWRGRIMTTGRMTFSTFIWGVYGRFMQMLWWLKWPLLGIGVATVAFIVVKLVMKH